MKKTILLLLISLSSYLGHAQSLEHERDSLKLSLQNEKNDTSRVLTLANLSFVYFESNPDTAMIMALQALQLSRKIGFAKGEAAGLNRISNAYGVIGGNEPKQMELLLQALKLNEKINNLDGLHRNNNNIGVLYRRQEDNRQAIEYFLKAKAFAEKAGNKKAISTALVNIGESYFKLRQFDSALAYVQQGHNIASEIGDPRMVGNSLRIMGEINAGKDQPKLAIEYYRLSFPPLLSTENYLSLSESFLGIAKSFEKSGQMDSALYYANQSYLISKEKRFTVGVRDVGRFLSLFYRNRGNPDSAFFYQDITKAANDSLFNEQKTHRFQSLAFEEKIRQADLAAEELKAKEERKNNLQYAGIAVGLILFVIIFLLLSHSIIVNQKIIQSLGIVSLLLVFEFINLFIHPYLAHATNHSPLLMLLVLVCIAALLVPAHHRLEKWISHRLVEKNKKIRLAAAKKTIEQLEG